MKQYGSLQIVESSHMLQNGRSSERRTARPCPTLTLGKKYSFLVWRALRGKLPTNDKLTSFGVEPARCICWCFRCIKKGWDKHWPYLCIRSPCQSYMAIFFSRLRDQHSQTPLKVLWWDGGLWKLTMKYLKLFSRHFLPVFVGIHGRIGARQNMGTNSRAARGLNIWCTKTLLFYYTLFSRTCNVLTVGGPDHYGGEV